MYYLINTSQNLVLDRSLSYEPLNEKRTMLYVKGATDCLIIVKEVLVKN